MDESRMRHAPSRGPGPSENPKSKWTARIVLWALASVIGLWLGTNTRGVAARAQASLPSARSEASIADVFRLDILLARMESPVRRVHPKAVQAAECELPVAVLLARQQRPEPVPSVMPKTLSNWNPRFSIAPPARPAWAGRVKLDAQMAQLGQAQIAWKTAIENVPGLTDGDRRSIQLELENVCVQVSAQRRDQAVHLPRLPEPSADRAEFWPEPPSARLMP